MHRDNVNDRTAIKKIIIINPLLSRQYSIQNSATKQNLKRHNIESETINLDNITQWYCIYSDIILFSSILYLFQFHFSVA